MTADTAMWIARKHLSWLRRHGKEQLAEVFELLLRDELACSDPASRTSAQVLQDRTGCRACCNRYADYQACDCLELAERRHGKSAERWQR